MTALENILITGNCTKTRLDAASFRLAGHSCSITPGNPAKSIAKIHR